MIINVNAYRKRLLKLGEEEFVYETERKMEWCIPGCIDPF